MQGWLDWDCSPPPSSGGHHSDDRRLRPPDPDLIVGWSQSPTPWGRSASTEAVKPESHAGDSAGPVNKSGLLKRRQQLRTRSLML